VVATAVSGNPELIEHGRNGLLVAPADPEALAQAVCWMLDNPEQARALGRTGRSTVMEEFSVKKMVERTEAVYRSLWNQAARSPDPGEA
jgi:glycosyltransferase involved in cell wall biosynthesis